MPVARRKNSSAGKAQKSTGSKSSPKLKVKRVSGKSSSQGRSTTTRRMTSSSKSTTSRRATSISRTRSTRTSSGSSSFKMGSKPFTKSELMQSLSEFAGVEKKQVNLLFETLGEIISQHLNKKSIQQFTMPGLMKITVKRKPATKARKGINPFTGEPTTFKAKPACNVVKVRPLKNLKDMV